MIDYIIYSEFDNNEGSLVKIEYPIKTGVSETILSSYMIPEGAHNIRSDTFCFIVNKAQNSKKENIFSEIKKAVNEFNKKKTIKYFDFSKCELYLEKIKDKGFQLNKIYNLNKQNKSWESLKTTEEYFKQNKNIFIKIWQDKKEKIFKFLIYMVKDPNLNINNVMNKTKEKEDVIFEIPIHADIQYQKLKENFVSLYFR